MTGSPYDLSVLQQRAVQWRAEAAVAQSEEMRIFCLNEADRCDRRVQKSLYTPVLCEVTEQPVATA